MAKVDSGSGGLGASRPIGPGRSAANAGGFSASGGASRPVSDLAGKLAETTKPIGRTFTEGRFTITKIHDKTVGRNPDRGQLWKVDDGVESGTAYSLKSAREMARYMMETPKEVRDAKRDALLKQLRGES